MKVLVVLLGLITATFLSGVAAVTVSIRVYSATGELDIRRDPFTLGTRVLLTCDVTGLSQDSEVVSYRWYHNCTGRPNSRCEIQDRDPYYRVVKDTLLVDVTSWGQGGVYYCNEDSLPVRMAAITRELAVAVTLRTSFVSGWDSSMWTLTSPDGSRVERYIVEFECRVRSITFAEKYMSVSASGGTGQVATNATCFGGLGQLHKVKVWAVSGPNISPALVCTLDGQCREEEGDRRTPTTPASVPTPSGNTDPPPLTPSGPQCSSTDHNHTQSEGTYIPSMVVPVSAGALMALVGIATFIAGVVMLVRAKRVLHHSSQPPPPGTDHYEMVDEGGKTGPLGAQVYEEVDKQDTQTDRHTKQYQELDLAKMERREYASIKVK